MWIAPGSAAYSPSTLHPHLRKKIPETSLSHDRESMDRHNTDESHLNSQPMEAAVTLHIKVACSVDCAGTSGIYPPC